jgi:hypothetical protein
MDMAEQKKLFNVVLDAEDRSLADRAAKASKVPMSEIFRRGMRAEAQRVLAEAAKVGAP